MGYLDRRPICECGNLKFLQIFLTVTSLAWMSIGVSYSCNRFETMGYMQRPDIIHSLWYIGYK